MTSSYQNSGTENYNEIAELQVSYHPIRREKKVSIRSSQDAADFLLETWDAGTLEYVEQFKVVLLNKANDIIGIRTISTGGLTACVVDPRNVFQTALLGNAAAIILSHNHPSGQLRPSTADRAITKKLQSAGEFLDIKVLDHIIMTADGYYSFLDKGEIMQ